MVDPDKDEEIKPEQLDPIGLLTLKVKKLQKLLIIGGVACALVMSSLVAATVLLSFSSSSVQSQQDHGLESIETSLTQMGLQMGANRSRSVEAIDALEELQAQFDKLDPDAEQHSIVKLQKILIRQEQDYRDFLANLQNGMYAMHLMIPHSRRWWEQYEGEIEQTAKLSKARENYLINLRNN